MENLNYDSRSLVFKEGTTAQRLFMVKSGEVLCLKSSKDRLIPIFLAKAGDIIGESAMIDGLPYTYSGISLSPSVLIPVDYRSFKVVFDKAPEWLSDLTTTMILRYQNTSNLIAENRIIHPSIISEGEFDSQTEIEFKKILS